MVNRKFRHDENHPTLTVVNVTTRHTVIVDLMENFLEEINSRIPYKPCVHIAKPSVHYQNTR